LNSATLGFLRGAYKEYYFRNTGVLEFPQDIEHREFGYIPFGGSMVRHLSFKSPGEAIAEIVRQAPSSLYCSNARYDHPSLEMEDKGWNGAELIFDIDANDIPTACKKSHDFRYCGSCYSYPKNQKTRMCANCGGSIVQFQGTCRVCLDATKNHVARLLNFLTDDFGTSLSNVRVYFSGNRGFHVHVFDSRFDNLKQQARAEIADYIRGSSLPTSQTLGAMLKRGSGAPKDQLMGWNRKIAIAIEPSRRDESHMSISEAIASEAAMIDSSVTTDIHRVFRLPGSLHGTTGMLKKRVDSLEEFDVINDPVVLSSETVRIDVKFYPKFSVKGNTYGPYKSEKVKLPIYAAIGILTREFGEIA
jgi:DNA primase small subunit